jgi:hypothetical protein
MPRTKSVAIIESPKGLVRRYKSLSDISYWEINQILLTRKRSSLGNYVEEFGMTFVPTNLHCKG